MGIKLAIADAVRNYASGIEAGSRPAPLDAFIGLDEAPTHTLYVEGNAVSVQAGYTLDEAVHVMRFFLPTYLNDFEEVQPPFEAEELTALRRAKAERGNHLGSKTEALELLPPSVRREVIRRAGADTWAGLVCGMLTSDLHHGLNEALGL